MRFAHPARTLQMLRNQQGQNRGSRRGALSYEDEEQGEDAKKVGLFRVSGPICLTSWAYMLILPAPNGRFGRSVPKAVAP